MTPRAAKSARTKTAPKTAPAAAASSAGLDTVFDELKAILARYAKGFSVREKAVKVGDKRDYHLILEKPLVIAGRPRKDLWFASLIQQKHSVGFYFVPINCCDGLREKISPELLRHLDGKACFHLAALTPQLKKHVDAALKAGLEACKHEGWL